LNVIIGAFVAGLDAGLLYNEFPLMGGRLAPPSDELFATAYAKSPDHSDLWWRNMLENPTTTQFDHRILVSQLKITYLTLLTRSQAVTTYFSTGLLYMQTFRPSLRAVLPPLTRAAATAAFAMVNVQVLLGISTLLYLVPVPIAAAHQAGSVMLLSTMVYLLTTLRRPGMAARAWRQAVQKGRP
jgi:heme a synthase